MASFPSLKPTARSFTPGEYPVKAYRAMSGATVRRSFGNKPFGHTLDLEFGNVPEATVNSIIDHYNGQGGSTLGFNLPAVVLGGYGSTLRGKIQNPAGTDWIYAQPPEVRSVIKDLSTVRVQLVAELNG